MKEEERDGGIRKATKEFLLLFLELVNMFVLHGGDSFWSKLNAEFSLFYFRLFLYWFCSLKRVTPVLRFL